MMMGDIGQNIYDIKNPLLGQTLILAPEVGIEDVTAALAACGLDPDGADAGFDTSPGSVPLTAGFAHHDQTPRAIFSTNPIVDLRILDVALCPPALRRRIATTLPVIDRNAVEQWSNDNDERIALRGFWAAVETERIDLLGIIAARQNDKNKLIAAEATRATERLESIDAARMTVLGGMGMVAKTALDMTHLLADPTQIKALLATLDDLPDLFTPDVVSRIDQSPADLFSNAPAFPMLPAKDDASVFAAAGGLFRDYSMLTRPFPMAFHDAAPWLLPGVIWVAWRGQDPRHGQTSYDGLAFTGRKWVYCPRPYRMILGALPPKTAELVLP